MLLSEPPCILKRKPEVPSSCDCLFSIVVVFSSCAFLRAAISSRCFVFVTLISYCYTAILAFSSSLYLLDADLVATSKVTSLSSCSLMRSWEVVFCREADDSPMLARNVLCLQTPLITFTTICTYVFGSSTYAGVVPCLAFISFCNMDEALLVRSYKHHILGGTLHVKSGNCRMLTIAIAAISLINPSFFLVWVTSKYSTCIGF